MERRLAKGKDEPLYKWCERIADELGMNEKQRDALSEVRKQSYIEGVNAERAMRKKFENLY
jgi:hypothetical protein